MMYEHSWELIVQNYEFIFQKYIKDKENGMDINRLAIKPKDFFISTGDGGYQIMETPIHAIIFVLTFATILRFYNSDLFMRKLHAKIGNIELRYAITLDDLYKYDDNYYGSSIINNSRILSKDKLNRLLIDNNVYMWFLDVLTGIENLMSLSLEELSTIEPFLEYDKSKIEEGNNALIPKNNIIQKEGIKTLDVQKIGKIKQKQSLIDVYNIHIQAIIDYINFFKIKKTLTVSVGNLNTVGIENEEI